MNFRVLVYAQDGVTLVGKRPQTPRGNRREANTQMLSLQNVRHFTDDFGISGRVISQKDILSLFRASIGLGAPSDAEAKTMDYTIWQQFLCRLAMHWGRVDHTASAEEVAQRLHKFLRTLEGSPAMLKVEDSLGAGAR